MELVLLTISAVYLTIGFIYAVYVVMHGGGALFSIPLNTLLGPLSLPFGFLSAVATISKKGRKGAPKPEEIPPLEDEIEPLVTTPETPSEPTPPTQNSNS